MQEKKKIIIWLIFAIAAEAVIKTDAFAVWIARLITSDMVMQGIIRYPLEYLFWISGILFIRAYYRRKPEIHFSYKETLSAGNILAGIFLLAVSITISYISWDGFKIYKELTGSINAVGFGLGIANFTAQYFYYFLEAILMTIIVAFSQEAGEALFKPRWIPWGGISLAVLWGLSHIVGHGITDGLTTTFSALFYGSAILAMKKNSKLTFILIFLMFIL
ncbi:MAG: hypothetical protein FWG36_06220 [Oscillospiraceae bacterium]|nr:hypothetical protein [Oscillospiraceae bacterium]